MMLRLLHQIVLAFGFVHKLFTLIFNGVVDNFLGVATILRLAGIMHFMVWFVTNFYGVATHNFGHL